MAAVQPLIAADGLYWVIEEAHTALGLRPKRMFGAIAWYHGNKLVWVNICKEEPFNGALIPTEKRHHAGLMADFPGLVPHVQLGKWLYLSQDAEVFEETCRQLAEALMNRDVRLGVQGSGEKKRKKGGSLPVLGADAPKR